MIFYPIISMGFQLSMLSSIPNETSPQIVYVGEEISDGTQGLIFRANLITGKESKQIAVKVWKDNVLPQECDLERQILLDLQGVKGTARLESFPGADSHKDRLFLEWAHEGDLFTLIERFQEKTNPPVLNHDHIYQLFEQLLTAIDAINKLGYVHRDIKPENILVYSLTDNKIEVGLSDFGLVVPINTNTGVAGTKPYLPPSCDRSLWHKYDGSEDMYGVGITLAILLQFLDKKEFKDEIKFANLVRKSTIKSIPVLMEELRRGRLAPPGPPE